MYNSINQRFIITSNILFENNTNTIDISKMIKDIKIKKNFVDNCFPLFVITIDLPPTVRDAIRDEKITISLKIDSYDFNSELENTENTATEHTLENNIMKTILIPYDKTLSSTVKIEDSDNDETNEEIDDIITYSLNCIPQNCITINNTVINTVYENANMNEIIVNIISEISDNPIYLEPADNTDRENSLLIPPLNVIPALRYLQNYYRIYENNLSIFFDTNKTYIYDNMQQDRIAFRNAIEIITKNSDSALDDTIYNAPIIDDKNNIKIYRRSDPIVGTNSDVYNNMIGETSVFNFYDDNFNTSRRVYNNNNTDNQKTRYFWNNSQNELAELSINNVSTKGTTINIANIDPRYFMPDSKFILNTTLEQTSGEYRLIEQDFLLSTTDYETFTGSLILALIKI